MASNIIAEDGRDLDDVFEFKDGGSSVSATGIYTLDGTFEELSNRYMSKADSAGNLSDAPTGIIAANGSDVMDLFAIKGDVNPWTEDPIVDVYDQLFDDVLMYESDTARAWVCTHHSDNSSDIQRFLTGASDAFELGSQVSTQPDSVIQGISTINPDSQNFSARVTLYDVIYGSSSSIYMNNVLSTSPASGSFTRTYRTYSFVHQQPTRPDGCYSVTYFDNQNNEYRVDRFDGVADTSGSTIGTFNQDDYGGKFCYTFNDTTNSHWVLFATRYNGTLYRIEMFDRFGGLLGIVNSYETFYGQEPFLLNAGFSNTLNRWVVVYIVGISSGGYEVRAAYSDSPTAAQGSWVFSTLLSTPLRNGKVSFSADTVMASIGDGNGSYIVATSTDFGVNWDSSYDPLPSQITSTVDGLNYFLSSPQVAAPPEGRNGDPARSTIWAWGVEDNTSTNREIRGFYIPNFVN